ncbi:MAG: alpha/beta fold hydrolase [Planctomycetota bacterium]
MIGELVHTMTEDHLRLHGFYSASTESVRTVIRSGNCDAAVLLHGLGGNFYSSRLLSHFSQTLRQFGISTLIGNTRGHDMINTSTWGGRARSNGAAFESVADCTYDVQGWVDFLVDKGHSSILLFGHSLGAIKSIFAQAYKPSPRVKAIIGLSATRLSYAKLIDSPRGELFRQTIARCQSLIDDKQGDQLIEVPFPFPTWMTPHGYLAKYGPDEAYNWIRFIDRVDVPTLLLFGQRELDENPAFVGLRDELVELPIQNPSVRVKEILNADHFYASQMSIVDVELEQWLTGY